MASASTERHDDDRKAFAVESAQYNPLAEQTALRKGVVVFFLCLAQFLDTFMNSALFAAIPPISQDLNISNANSVWLISGYQLTFAALLLISGRLSDLYNPKYVFTVGATLIGGLSLGGGFVRHEVPLILIRVLTGIASQSQAIAAFGASAALGNVIGLIIGALIVSYASWPWVFYLFSILGFMLAIVVFVLAPSPHRPHVSALEKALRFKRLDLLGVSMLTSGLVLFIFGVTSGSVDGWGSAICLAPLIVSIFLVAAFFVYESRLDEHYAALPPNIWRYQNFPILVASALLPFMWWGTVQLLFSWLWQEVYGWSAIIAALHFLPLGLLGFPMNGLSSALSQKFPLKWVIIAGQVVALAGSILLPFADSEAHYWRYAFPGFCLGTSGITIIYTGRRAGFWFLFGLLALLTAAQLVFMKNTVPPMKNGPKEKDVDEKDTSVRSRDGNVIERA
ncbi:hypothetical protein AN958_05215 [Leucoagaricus sp. SymC.cos]|nr:hypothetical protein AN958_05215 [Leucoagaricus sp. SymC.cos]